MCTNFRPSTIYKAATNLKVCTDFKAPRTLWNAETTLSTEGLQQQKLKLVIVVTWYCCNYYCFNWMLLHLTACILPQLVAVVIVAWVGIVAVAVGDAGVGIVVGVLINVDKMLLISCWDWRFEKVCLSDWVRGKVTTREATASKKISYKSSQILPNWNGINTHYIIWTT